MTKFKFIWEKVVPIYIEGCEKDGEPKEYQFTVIQDEGCRYHNSCFTCPFPDCKFVSIK